MKTSETINTFLKGNDYDVDEVISYVLTSIKNVNIRDDLFSSEKTRSYHSIDNFAGCSIENLKNETAFSRALFNQRFLSIDGNFTAILGYEIALSNDQKVDVLGFDFVENKLIAIEYKYNPTNKDTGIEYGLIEAYIYGHLLDKYIRKNHGELKSIIINRLDQLNLSYLKKIVEDREIKSEYILSAPVSYFLEFINNDSVKAKQRFERIMNIEEFLKNNIEAKKHSTFGGYYPIAEISHKRQCVILKEEGESSFPYLMTKIPSIERIQGTCRLLSE